MITREKLSCILLIDDDEATNYLNEKVIEEIGCADKVIVKNDAETALAYLNSYDDEHPKPKLTFVDINMPGMNGWEFVERYKKIKEKSTEQSVLIMLSTSINPSDIEKANKINVIDGYRSKPLTKEMIDSIIAEYF